MSDPLDTPAPLDPTGPMDGVCSRRWFAPAEVLLIFLVFFIFAGWPVPEVNEAHYLSKAKHYWNADWAAGDFFCETADAHLVFYWTFGWLTQWFSLTATAWIGRLVTWALLAWSWRRLSFACLPRPGYAVLSASLFLAMVSHGHMAGEWVVGGLEAKGLAYALVFFGLAAVVRGRWNHAWLWLGGASAFHVLVGGWATVAAGIAWLARRGDRPRLRAMLPWLLAGLLLALPGIFSAIWLSVGSAETVGRANIIYVFRRLPHHLVLTRFEPWLVARHAMLVILWIGVSRLRVPSVPLRRLRPAVHGAVGLVVVGLMITLLTRSDKDLAASLLRLYWFRLSDALVPLGLAIFACGWIARLRKARRPLGDWLLVAAMLLAGANLAEVSLRRQQETFPPAEAPSLIKIASEPIDPESWWDACYWVAENTSSDARFLIPHASLTFRWHTGRAEVVNRKDIPQDAAGIVEWWDRIDTIYRYDDEDRPGRRRWHDSLAAETMGAARLIELCRQYDADYVVTKAWPRLALELVYRNRSYAVYRSKGTSPAVLAPPSQGRPTHD